MFGSINVKTLSYDVIAKKNEYEIRRYHKQFLAQSTYEVPTNVDFLSKTVTEFYPLFKFISGNNEIRTKISMTAPVIMQETSNENGVKRTMSFVVSPSKFSLGQIPKANDQNI